MTWVLPDAAHLGDKLWCMRCGGGVQPTAIHDHKCVVTAFDEVLTEVQGLRAICGQLLTRVTALEAAQ